MESVKKTYVVSGSAGFLGFHLCQKILADGHNVFGIDNFLTGSKKNHDDLQNEFGHRFVPIFGDVCDPITWKKISADKGVIKNIFHLASPASPLKYQKYAIETLKANSEGLLTALAFADTHGARLVFTSTSEVYGSQQKIPMEESDWGYVNPRGDRSCYDEAKRFGEALLYSWNKKKKTQHGVVRIFNTYGPKMDLEDGRAIPELLKSYKKSTPFSVYGNGEQTRCFTFATDLIEGLCIYAETKETEPINLGSENEISIQELIQIFQKVSGTEVPLHIKSALNDDPTRRKPNLSKAKGILNWEAKTSLEAGLRKTLESL